MRKKAAALFFVDLDGSRELIAEKVPVENAVAEAEEYLRDLASDSGVESEFEFYEADEGSIHEKKRVHCVANASGVLSDFYVEIDVDD